VATQYGIDKDYLYKTTVYPPKLPACLLDQGLQQQASFSKPVKQEKRLSSLSGLGSEEPTLKSQMEHLIQI
jgi:hypothetical protein